MKKSIVLIICAFAVFSCKQEVQQAKSSIKTDNAVIPVADHVLTVILENHAYVQIVGNSAAPYINSLIADPLAAVFIQSYGIGHPSQPNYLYLFSGANQGVTTDNNPPNDPFTTNNLGAELIQSGRTFTTYSESLPSVGYNGDASGAYRRKHNPVANWMGTGTNQIPTTTNQPFTAFPSSANYASLPTVCYVVPNQTNDMHDGTDPARITTADTWVQNNLGAYITWAKTHNSVFILTFDEDNGANGNRILTIMIGQRVKKGNYGFGVAHAHFLRMVQDMYGLAPIGKSITAKTIDYCWN